MLMTIFNHSAEMLLSENCTLGKPGERSFRVQPQAKKLLNTSVPPHHPVSQGLLWPRSLCFPSELRPD